MIEKYREETPNPVLEQKYLINTPVGFPEQTQFQIICFQRYILKCQAIYPDTDSKNMATTSTVCQEFIHLNNICFSTFKITSGVWVRAKMEWAHYAASFPWLTTKNSSWSTEDKYLRILKNREYQKT